MSMENLEQFWQVLSENLMLQQELETAPDLRSFVNLLVDLGAAYGYQFTAEEVEVYIGLTNGYVLEGN